MTKTTLLILIIGVLSACGSDNIQEPQEPQKVQEVRIVRDHNQKIVHVKHTRMDLYTDVTSDEQISNKDLIDGLAQLHKAAKDDIRAIGLFRKMLNDENRLLAGLSPTKIDQMAKLLSKAYERGLADARAQAIKAKQRTVTVTEKISTNK